MVYFEINIPTCTFTLSGIYIHKERYQLTWNIIILIIQQYQIMSDIHEYIKLFKTINLITSNITINFKQEMY